MQMICEDYRRLKIDINCLQSSKGWKPWEERTGSLFFFFFFFFFAGFCGELWMGFPCPNRLLICCFMDHLSKISQMIDLIFLLEDGIVLLSTLNSVLVVESCYFLVSLSPVPNNTDLPICHTCTFSSTLLYCWNNAICLAFTATFF